MMDQWIILDVSGEFIMDIAKAVASSPYPLSKEDLLRSFRKSKVYIVNAISQALQLGLIESQDGINGPYMASASYRELIRRCDIEQLYLPFREALQKYPPFLLYIEFIAKGYPSEKAATMVRGIFRISSSEKIVEKSLRNWGIYAQLLRVDKFGTLIAPEAEKGLSTEYVKNLLKALSAELQANIFIIETIGQQAFTYLLEKRIDIKDLVEALISYEEDPKASAYKACRTFEHFLFEMGKGSGADIGACKGIIEYANAIKGKNVILKNHLHLCHGIGGLRNMADHAPDRESGKPWTFTPQGALLSVLLVLTVIRSIYLYWREEKQEL